MTSSISVARRVRVLAFAAAAAALCSVGHAAALVISGQPAARLTVGQSYDFRPNVSGASGALKFTISNKPHWVRFNSTSGRMSGVVPAYAGTRHNIILTVSDGKRTSTLPAFAITIAKANTAPTITGSPSLSITAGTVYSFLPKGSDAEGDKLTYEIRNKPAWATFSAGTGALTGKATAGTTSGIVISVSDGRSKASLPAFTITVASPNSAPRLGGTPVISTFVGRRYAFVPTAADADGDELTFSVQNKPAWAKFDATTGEMSGTPAAPGRFANIVITASDGRKSVSLAAFTLDVLEAVKGSATLSWEAPTRDVKGSPLTNLAGYRVVYGSDPTRLNRTIDLPRASLTSVEIGELDAGTHYFAVKAYTTTGIESDLTDVVWKTIM